MSFNSKYKSLEIEQLLDQVANVGAGGGGAASMKIYEHGENDTTMTIEPSTYHKWGEVSELTISLGEPADESVVNEYMFSFDNKSLTPQLTIDELMWEHGEHPEFAFLAKNVVKIMDGLAKIESYALETIVLSDSYLSDSDGQKAIDLYNLLYNGGYTAGIYDTNGASISVDAYSELLDKTITGKVKSLIIPYDDGYSNWIGINTENEYVFRLNENGTITYIGN